MWQSYLLRGLVTGGCLLSLISWAAEPTKPSLRIAWQSSNEPLAQISSAILTTAYTKLDQPMQLVSIPLRRSLQMTVQGQLDGELQRIAELAEQYPALLQVRPALSRVELRLYARDRAIQARNWEEVAGSRLAYERGVLLIERRLPKQQPVVEANQHEEVFRLVQARMADLALVVEAQGQPADPLARQYGVQRLPGQLAQVPLYHYLHGNHIALARQLGQVLRDMERSGESERIRTAVIQRLGKTAAEVPDRQ